MGAGEKLDEANATLIKTGGYASAPVKSPHYAFTKEGCIVQIHAMGPFVINYINPAEMIRPKKINGTRSNFNTAKVSRMSEVFPHAAIAGKFIFLLVLQV